MYITRKVYSIYVDEETGEERLFSENQIMDEEEYLEKLYSEGEKRKRTPLKRVESDKGMKRAFLLSPFDGGGGLVGGYLSKAEADKADEEGESDSEILRRAKKRGLEAGALTGAASGVVGGLAFAKKTGGRSLVLPVAHTAIGALGGRNAASVNTKARLAKRRERDDD